MRISLLLSVAAIAAITIIPLGATAQDMGKLYKKVKGWTVNQYAASESSPGPSCSAVRLKDHIQALRIERFKEGYLAGFNGLSRKEQWNKYPMKFWFDGNRSQEASGEGEFVKDAAYPLDDWLSFYIPADAKPSPVDAVKNLNSISFAYQIPGNRTGNDEVTITYKLVGSAAALLALDECYQRASSGGSMKVSGKKPKILSRPAKKPAGTDMGALAKKSYDRFEGAPAQKSNTMSNSDAESTCPTEGPRLPGSGICQYRGVNYLNIVDGPPPILQEGCDWRLNEAAMPNGGYLLYLAELCNGKLATLKFSSGKPFSEVTLDGNKVITVGAVDMNNPRKNVLIYARNAMKDKAEAAKCRVVDAPNELAADALMVDVSAAEAAKAPKDEPRFACGPFGLDDETTSFWRVFDGYSWHFELGQDAYKRFDPRSLTVISAADLPKL